MSLESKIEQLSKSIDALVTVLGNVNVPVAAPVVEAKVEAPAPAPAPVEAPVAPAPVATPEPLDEVYSAPAAPEMPAAPSFEAAPAPTPVTNNAPFTDGNGLIAYVMESYKALGADKGAQIQGVLTGLGYSNINDVKPEHYNALFSGIEALK